MVVSGGDEWMCTCKWGGVGEWMCEWILPLGIFQE